MQHLFSKVNFDFQRYSIFRAHIYVEIVLFKEIIVRASICFMTL